MDKKKTTPEKEAALKALRPQFIGTDAATQRDLLLAALRMGFAITTLEARTLLDIGARQGSCRLSQAAFC